ncbi:hypothetical protein [Paenibacillus pini]|uniref:Uncharacterized protein n=1 Tax=Paenibacillus pini JCM 16418 TaxID=1236976 RepID=W7YGS4_9BACL|nr:hypothetical protein [Paenibacillus pini]GAF06798.1 hypothetical protein JCM16418_780 [Paenibacillus pini JCM 16418]
MELTQSKWCVFEFLKDQTLATGHIPSRDEVETKFAGLDLEELEGGIKEFQLRVGNWGNAKSSLN